MMFSPPLQKTTSVICGMPNNMSKCPLCHSSPKDFKEVKEFPVKNPEFLEYGISPLHFGMRAMENIFKMGFNSDFCDWYATVVSGNAALRDAKKKKVLEDLRAATGIRAFEPRQDGGTSNTGQPSFFDILSFKQDQAYSFKEKSNIA